MISIDGMMQLYEDALYTHFLCKGYTEERARAHAAELVRKKFGKL